MPSPSDQPTDAPATTDLPPAVLPAVASGAGHRPPLVTVRRGAVLAGLLGGLALRYGLDEGPLRAIVVVLFLLGLVLWLPLAAFVVTAYVVAWIVLPQEDELPRP